MVPMRVQRCVWSSEGRLGDSENIRKVRGSQGVQWGNQGVSRVLQGVSVKKHLQAPNAPWNSLLLGILGKSRKRSLP